MSAQTLDKISGLVAMNSLMAMVGGTLVALVLGKNDPGFVHNGPLAGLVAVCAGSDLMHPMGALVTGGVAGGLFVFMFTLTQNRWKIDDVLGVWPLHGLCGAWGGIACGHLRPEGAGRPRRRQPSCRSWPCTALGIAIALVGGFASSMATLKSTVGLRLDAEEEFNGADLSIHKNYLDTGIVSRTGNVQNDRARTAHEIAEAEALTPIEIGIVSTWMVQAGIVEAQILSVLTGAAGASPKATPRLSA
jgi:Amt family ammonium transporter